MASAAFGSSLKPSSPAKCHLQTLQNKSLFGGLLPSSSLRSSAKYSFKNAAIKCSSETVSASVTAEAQVYFHSPVWDSNQIITAFTTDPAKVEDTSAVDARLQQLKLEVTSMFSLAANNSFQELDLINKLQRLGLAYQFEHTIESILERIYNQGSAAFEDATADLYITSVWFRVMRAAGYRVPTDVFNKFKDDKGEFIESDDVLSVLSMYEASYYSIAGEDIMDEVQAFTTKHLNSMLAAGGLSAPLALEVKYALKTPIQQTIERAQTRHYISIYQHDESRSDILLEFSKLDFNAVQKTHQKELAEFLTWYEDLDVKSNVPFDARNRGVESYLIPGAILFEPQFSEARVQLAKLWVVLSLLDDAHDVYGNIEELGPLCDAIQKWDDADLDSLTDHMKFIFLAIFGVMNDIEHDMIKKGHFLGLQYLKREIQRYSQGQFDECKILFTKDLPSVEECLQIFFITAGFLPYLVNSTMHIPEIAKKEVFDYIESAPKIVHCCYLITRILDDMAAPKLEHARGITISSVTCYQKQHGVSEEEAMESLNNMVPAIWKDINEECLKPHPVPMPVLKFALNASRTMQQFYCDGIDGYSISEGRTEELVRSLLIDPIP